MIFTCKFSTPAPVLTWEAVQHFDLLYRIGVGTDIIEYLENLFELPGSLTALAPMATKLISIL